MVGIARYMDHENDHYVGEAQTFSGGFAVEQENSNKPSSATKRDVVVCQIISVELILSTRQGNSHACCRTPASPRQDRVTVEGSPNPCGEDARISAAEDPHPAGGKFASARSQARVRGTGSPHPCDRIPASVRQRSSCRGE